MTDVLIFASSVNFAELEAEKNMSAGKFFFLLFHRLKIKYITETWVTVLTVLEKLLFY